MADVDISPNMNLPVPQVNREIGPDWATDYNACMQRIDQHDHASSNGVPISQDGINLTPSALTFDSLDFGGSNAFDLRTVKFLPQTSTPALPTDVGCLTEVGVDLYYIDGAGNPIRLTQGGSIVGTAGSITGLPSGTASASYAGGTFTWESATNTAANMDAGSYVYRNASAGSFGLTLNPPNAMTSDFDVFLPEIPSSKSIMTLDASGNMAGDYTTDNVTVGINGSDEFYVPSAGISALQLNDSSIGDSPVNIGILPSVATNALTFTLTDQAGSTPSTTSPVKIKYRSTTIGVAEPEVAINTAATTITIPQGGTLGFSSGIAGTIYIYGVNNGSVTELAVSNTLFSDGDLVSTTVVSLSPTLPGVVYSNNALIDVAIKLLGVATATVTAGNWTIPTYMSLWGANVPRGPALSVYQGANKALTSALTIYDFDSKVTDTQNNVATGASWKYTARTACVCWVSVQVATATYTTVPPANLTGSIYVNGSFYSFCGFGQNQSAAATSAVGLAASVPVVLAAGDYLDFRTTLTGTGTFSTNSTYNQISILQVPL